MLIGLTTWDHLLTIFKDVVRNWYARNSLIVETEDNLVALAQECAHAFIDGKTSNIIVIVLGIQLIYMKRYMIIKRSEQNIRVR